MSWPSRRVGEPDGGRRNGEHAELGRQRVAQRERVQRDCAAIAVAVMSAAGPARAEARTGSGPRGASANSYAA